MGQPLDRLYSMTLRLLIVIVVCIALGMVVLKARQVMGKDVIKDPNAPATQPAAGGASPLTFTGKVVMIINVASKCGFTKQYAGLEKLYEKYKDRGLVIVGFPANNFNSQE